MKKFFNYLGRIWKQNRLKLVVTFLVILFLFVYLLPHILIFVEPGEDIYEGQVIGENSRRDDMTVNITKTKKMSNVRSSGADDKAKIVPAIKFSLEEALEFIQKDEYVEVTPNFLRLRKVYLSEHERKRNPLK